MAQRRRAASDRGDRRHRRPLLRVRHTVDGERGRLVMAKTSLPADQTDTAPLRSRTWTCLPASFSAPGSP
jgi:hypothetical protein